MFGQEVRTATRVNGSVSVYTLSNNKVTCTICISSGILSSDTLSGDPQWLEGNRCPPFRVVTSAGFGLQLVWTDWQAPHADGNAENPVILGNEDFKLTSGNFNALPDGASELVLDFNGTDAPYNPLLLKITYHLDPDAFFIRRKIAVYDTAFGHHYLDRIISRSGKIQGYLNGIPVPGDVFKNGGFGQPAAAGFGQGGVFFGLEYPAATNLLEKDGSGNLDLSCFQEFGTRVQKEPVESEWVAEGLVPGSSIREWFFRYLDYVRVAPARPYVLYNSWYDLRSPEYPHVEPAHVMNEQNVLGIIGLFRKNMIEKHHIPLDAFVLDDGWDVYESDWVLRPETFPHGLKPIADTLQKLGTGLGIWLGPTGGYSFRMKRVDWMAAHGYETVGTNRDNKMLCLAGKNYSALFRKRVTGLVSESGVSYFKWDGIQFSCSEPDHGHPVGIYSRRAVMESVIDKCLAVRKVNPKVYLNITSGTWLSPWWLKYANTIWMQGEDYGYANIPSIHPRDAAMTYKDLVLYDDLVTHDLWFPVSNLMTHGIIKGNLERLGGEDDPLDKFTNDAVFYVARGISMYELYISPDLLNGKEWDAIGDAIAWAKDRFDILSGTSMVGGPVGDGKSYGYLHFKGNRGIIAARNPVIGSSVLTVDLSPSMGFDPGAANLVLEKVYPYHWISPNLYAAGNTLTLPLGGFETAIYEIYPLSEATEPLVAGAKFDIVGKAPDSYSITIYDHPLGIKVLNPEIIRTSNLGPTEGSGNETAGAALPEPLVKNGKNLCIITQGLHPDPKVREARFALLLEPTQEKDLPDHPNVTFIINGKEVKPFVEESKGKWTWCSAILDPGTDKVEIRLENTSGNPNWKGTAELWLISRVEEKGETLMFTTIKQMPSRPMLPMPFGPGIEEKTDCLGKIVVEVK
ncbi:MAG TPA: alpha-galactosidase [Bacteroidales bacterium]|nr:alpha-galactosidase [Bacteroidales bacterium]